MADVVISPEDKRFYVKNPDASFSPRRNKAIIQETIVETEKFFQELSNIHDKDMQNRLDILSTYATYRFNRGTKNIKQYLGDRLSKEIIGEKILSKVRVLQEDEKLRNREKFIQV